MRTENKLRGALPNLYKPQLSSNQMCHDTDHLLSKLRQIDALAQHALNDAPPGLAKDRIRLIAGLAKYLATEIELRARQRG